MTPFRWRSTSGRVLALVGQPARLILAVLAAFSVTMPAFGQSSGHDGSLPIEISADSLEVAQDEQIATFAGNVDAVQGDLVLSADELKVHYDDDSEAVGISAGRGNKIRQIDAEGNVIISSPEEIAEGDFGTYDVPAKLVTLLGKVVVTRGANVIRGERLEMDLESGKSRMVGTVTSDDQSGGETGSGRVKALFTPKHDDDDGGKTPVPEARPQ